MLLRVSSQQTVLPWSSGGVPACAVTQASFFVLWSWAFDFLTKINKGFYMQAAVAAFF